MTCAGWDPLDRGPDKAGLRPYVQSKRRSIYELLAQAVAAQRSVSLPLLAQGLETALGAPMKLVAGFAGLKARQLEP